jgi:molybdopterin-biosynthesis enzyme MoeA-like protein
MAKIAKVEGEKASKAMKAHEAAEAEKQALLDRLARPSGLSDDEVMEKAAIIVNRAVENGMTSVQVFRFPNHICTDNGRAINQVEDGWEQTLTGVPKEIYDFWKRQLKPRGYHIRYEIIDYPGGMPGDVGIFLSWR